MSTTDQIKKIVTLRAPRSRVWRAISNAGEFSTWFRFKLNGLFVSGTTVLGHPTFPGYEGLSFEMQIERIEPSITSPTAGTRMPSIRRSITPRADHPRRVSPGGCRRRTLLTITESGFDQIPPGRRDEAFRMNTGGWDDQAESLAAYVAQP